MTLEEYAELLYEALQYGIDNGYISSEQANAILEEEEKRIQTGDELTNSPVYEWVEQYRTGQMPQFDNSNVQTDYTAQVQPQYNPVEGSIYDRYRAQLRDKLRTKSQADTPLVEEMGRQRKLAKELLDTGGINPETGQPMTSEDYRAALAKITDTESQLATLDNINNWLETAEKGIKLGVDISLLPFANQLGMGGPNFAAWNTKQVAAVNNMNQQAYDEAYKQAYNKQMADWNTAQIRNNNLAAVQNVRNQELARRQKSALNSLAPQQMLTLNWLNSPEMNNLTPAERRFIESNIGNVQSEWNMRNPGARETWAVKQAMPDLFNPRTISEERVRQLQEEVIPGLQNAPTEELFAETPEEATQRQTNLTNYQKELNQLTEELTQGGYEEQPREDPWQEYLKQYPWLKKYMERAPGETPSSARYRPITRYARY